MLSSAVTFQIIFFILLLDYARVQNTNDAISLQNATCPSGQFKCDSSQCIDELKLCDGTADCNDNSDETIEVCNSEQCPDESFMCEYGACIHMNGRCNGFKDCFDWSDEESCPYTKSFDYFGCELPDNPPHGEYAVISHLSGDYHSGDIIPMFGVLSLSCHIGYVINPPEDDGLSYCLPTREFMPVPKTCVRMSLFSAGCRLPNNPSNGKYAVINHVSAGYKPGDIVPVFSLLTVNCNNGYTGNPLELHLVSYCLPTEEWSPAPTTCVVMPIVSEGCRIPKNPSYGIYSVESALGLPARLKSELTSGDMVPVHSQLSLKCFKGYKVNSPDDELPNCTTTGEWSSAPQTCVYPDQKCQVPINPLNGKYVVFNYSSNFDVDYFKNNPETKGDEYDPGDIVPLHSILFLNCKEGFEVNPSIDGEPSNCSSTGKWVPSPKTCFQGCRLPDNPLHGEYVVKYEDDYDKFDEDDKYYPEYRVPLHSSLYVNCKKGYEVSPSTDDKPSNCTSTGRWVPSPKTCFQGCRIPDNPLNGKYVVKDDKTNEDKYYPGDIVPVDRSLSVHCDEGYVVSQSTNNEPSKCTSKGRWVPFPRSCFQGCRFPDNPLNGKYVLKGDETSDDKYHPGDIVPVYRTLSVDCNEGYEVSTSTDDEPSTCTSRGRWVPSPKACFQGCSVPDNPLHGKYVVEDDKTEDDKYHPGDFVPLHRSLSVHCDEGYEVSPSTDDKSSNCTSTGKWVPSPKTCFQGCLFPDNPLNGKYVVKDYGSEDDKYHPGDIVPVDYLLDIDCNEGYEVNPSTNSVALCRSTGKWVPPPQTCFQGCRFPDNPLHGKYVVEDDKTEDDKYHPGDIVPVDRSLSVHCNEGYAVDPSINDEASTCTSTGRWVPSPKTCFEGCRFPDNPLNGKYVLKVYETEDDKYHPGDIVPVGALLFTICNEIFKNAAICASTGKWVPSPEACVSPSLVNQGCEIPSSPSHGVYIINNNLSENIPGHIVPVESVLSVECIVGYADNPPNIENLSRCESTGEWIPAPKTCARACPLLISTNTTNVVCEFNGKPLNTCSNAVENTIARLSCAPFYEESNLEKYPTRSCNDGRWNYPIPQCYPICGKSDSSDDINNKYRDIFRSWYPWYVGVYKKVRGKRPLEYTCRGSIIREHIVLSAARCFADNEGKKYPKENFEILAATYFLGEINQKAKNEEFQYSRVHAIHIPESFKGAIDNYEADVAIIILSTPFQLSANVQPVCIDLETVHDETQEEDNEIFSILSPNNCSEKVAEMYKKYITNDKICLKYTQSMYALICVARISGNALAYPNESTDRYFVKGITSTEFEDKASLCSVAYTSVDYHIDFIRKLIMLYSR